MSQFFKILFVFLFITHNCIALEDYVIATVNDSPITKLDVQKRSELMLKSSGLPQTKEYYETIKEKVLETLIDEKLINIEGEELGITLSDDAELESAYLNLAQKNGMSLEQFKQHIKNAKLDMTALNQQIKQQILWSKIVAMRIQPNISVSKNEIEAARKMIEERKKIENQTADLRRAEIVFYIKNKKDLDNKKSLATKIISQLQNKGDFASIARQFSQGYTAKSGGDLGFINSSQLNANISKQLMALAIGKTTDIILLEDGIHIFKLLDKKNISSKNITPIEDSEIENELIERKLENEIRAYFKKMQTAANISIYKK